MEAPTDEGSALLSWSGGKDAAMALFELQRAAGPTVTELLTTVAATTERTSMHGVRPALIAAQADALDLPLELVRVPGEGSNEAYERVMRETLAAARERGIETVVFADIFLEDVRAYRQAQLAETALTGAWPLWERETEALLRRFLDAGFRATIVAIDGSALPPAFVGRELTRELLADLPPDVDPCGEHGEFHTFVWDGPIFSQPVPIRTGRRLTRTLDGVSYHYVDVLPASP